MKKEYFKYAAVAVLGSALISVLFSAIYFIADTNIAETSPLLEILAYIKKSFDILALFIGYGTIIFTFARFGTVSGIWSVVLFFCSFLVSVVWQIIGTCIDAEEHSLDFIIFTLYYSFGSGFITQMVPAILIAFIAYKLAVGNAQNPTKFISMENPPQKAMIISTLIIFGVNFLIALGFDILPFLIEEDFYITVNDFKYILFALVEIVVYYLVVLYVVYFTTYKLYNAYTNNNEEK